ncbi:phosphoribosylanthranilate isomerase [Marinicella rhabdoformis]|uniref:phosphoribosylanthranilate isomerase n=1 Tax=Marinicella rhabdoformis TaxID=2580566 RepID=UPI0015D0333B
MTIKIKYCGLKQKEEVELASKLGIDAIGLVFVSKSPRYVTIEEGEKLSLHLRNFSASKKPKVVALFVNPTAEYVAEVLARVKPDVLQFHGQETPEFCRQFNHTYWKAIAMLDNQPWVQSVNCYHDAEYCLLDSYQSGQLGGSGEAFDWFNFPVELRHRLILAGGLNIENINQAINQTQTQYLDVSSGIESSRGVKSPLLMKQLFHLVNPS